MGTLISTPDWLVQFCFGPARFLQLGSDAASQACAIYVPRAREEKSCMYLGVGRVQRNVILTRETLRRLMCGTYGLSGGFGKSKPRERRWHLQ